MHNWKDFIMTSNCKFTCMISCMLILIQYQWANILLLQKHCCELQEHINLRTSPKTLAWILLYTFRRLWVWSELWWYRIKKQPDHTSNDKVDFFRKIIVVIEEKCFDDMNLTYGATSPTALIKRAKTGCNKKIKFPRDTNWHLQKIAIRNVWNTQIVQILHEKRDEMFQSKFA